MTSRPLPRLLPLVFIAALTALAFASPPRGARAAAQAANTFDLRDFGAVGDGATDDAPALRAALDALAAAGGGRLIVPAGRYVIASPVHKDFAGLADAVSIEGIASDATVDTTGTPTQLATGLGLVSEFFPRTREAHVALSLRGLRSLLVRDIAFVGTPDVTTDALNTLAVEEVERAVVRHCEFYGLSSLVSAVIHARRSGLHLEQTKFLGTVSNSGIYAPVVDNLEWKAVTLADVVFLDYGLRPELFGKTGYGAPYSWVNVGNAAAVTADSPRREVAVRRVFLDEGGYVGLSSLPFRYEPPTAPVDLYYITGLRMNVSNLRTTGHYFDGLNALLVENSRYGWSHNTDSAIYVLRSGHAILDRIHTEAAATRLRADASVSSLTVINSVYEDLASVAAVTRVIETVEDADDPVWHVRQRFLSVAGREPDPAAHYYWSRRLLTCGEGNAACVATERAALEDYLGQNPAPVFAIEGVVTAQGGSPLAGVALTLSGSQAVSTVTDAEGRYRFSNLPTSGAYTVTPSKEGAAFAPQAAVFKDPSGDRMASFATTQPPALEFGSAAYTVGEAAGAFRITVVRRFNTAAALSVVYSAADGTAGQGADLSTVIGRLDFAPGETSKAFDLFIIDDAYPETDEQLTLSVRDPSDASVRATAILTIEDDEGGQPRPNPADDAQFFVRQHYRDFLGREPDEAGLQFWANQIDACPDAECRRARRVEVSAAFFLSIEFQETGFLVYRLYRASYGRAPRRAEEFLFDSRLISDGVIVGTPGWAEKLAANKRAFYQAWVQRPDFRALYDALDDARFVDALFANMGLTPTAEGREALLADLRGGVARHEVLAKVAEGAEFARQETSPAFVLMQYFGYLQRNPDESPDTNLDGYHFWLQKLTDHGGDWRAAEMVRSFIESIEYRRRFGQ